MYHCNPCVHTAGRCETQPIMGASLTMLSKKGFPHEHASWPLSSCITTLRLLDSLGRWPVVGARQDRLRVLQGLHFARARLLSEIEVVKEPVALIVEIPDHLVQLHERRLRCLLLFLRRLQRRLRVCFR